MADAVERIHVNCGLAAASMAHPRGKSHRPQSCFAARGRDGREDDGCKLKFQCAGVGAKTRSVGRSGENTSDGGHHVTKRLKAAVLCCVLAASMALPLFGCSGNTETYEPETKDPALSTPTIGQNGVLRVGVDASNSPLSGTVESDGEAKIVGLDVDIAAALADEWGLELSIVDVGTDFADALSSGEVDIVMGIDASSSEDSFWHSDTYLSTGVALFAASVSAEVPTASDGSTIAAQVSSKSSWAVTNEFGADALTSTTSLLDSFESLADGSVQYVAADAVVGSYAAYSNGIDAHMVALMQQPSGYCIGVPDANTALKTAVADAVATLPSTGEISVIETKWLGEPMDLSSLPLTAGAESTNS